VSYAADGWQAYVTANPLYQNGEPDEETTLLLKLTADCAEGEVGFKDVAGADRVCYIIATDTSDVPGQPSGTPYDGWVILHGEDDGATLAALQHAAGARKAATSGRMACLVGSNSVHSPRPGAKEGRSARPSNGFLFGLAESITVPRGSSPTR